MNAKVLRQDSTNLRRSNRNSEWRLVIGVLVAVALFLLLAGRSGQPQATSAATIQATPDSSTPAVINNHLYVPCSVSSCDPTPAVINNHLYVPCSVSSCDPTPAATTAAPTTVPATSYDILSELRRAAATITAASTTVPATAAPTIAPTTTPTSTATSQAAASPMESVWKINSNPNPFSNPNGLALDQQGNL